MSEHEVRPLLGQVSEAVAVAIGRIRPDLAGADPVVRRSEHADFQANAALALAKRVQAKPRDFAAELVEALGPEIGSIEVSGPGFINVDVPTARVWGQVAARLSDDRLGVARSDLGRRTVVDYSGPNIAKEMHVGHLRTTIIGDCLSRVLDHLGADVVRQNHLGDWGTQFGMLIQYLDEHPDVPWRQEELSGNDSAVSALDGLYKAARGQFDADERFADRARLRVVALQAGQASTVDRWREIVAESEKAFETIYERLAVLLTPKDSAGESTYNPLLADTVSDLLADGIAEYSDGAVVVQSKTIVGQDDRPAVLILRKRDGGYGYDTTDMATIRYRVRDLDADRLIYVTDTRQSLHFQLVFDAARRAGWLTNDIEATHVAYGTVLGPDGRPFKTRAGGTVRLLNLLDDAVARARAVVAEKAPELDDSELDDIAHQAGIGAVKYADLSTSRNKDYVFDVDRMVSFTGNTGVYLQYAHTRMCSILRRAGDQNVDVDVFATLEDAERALALTLDGFTDVLGEVGRTLEPHRLCVYLYDLARHFTTFYESCPVLTADEPVRSNRLALCRLSARTLAQGLRLLGIAAPERL